MPMKRELYPADWDAIALSIKTAANWTCEFCGKPCRPPGISQKETEQWLMDNHPEWLPHLYATVEDNEHGTVEVTKPQRFTLTVAHMNHVPSDCDRQNLKALCSVCHCRYDSTHHANSRRTNALKRREELGQLTLNLKNDDEI